MTDTLIERLDAAIAASKDRNGDMLYLGKPDALLVDARDAILEMTGYIALVQSLEKLASWQPIETAPKEGEIFVWGSIECSPGSRPRVGSEDIERVYWNPAFKSWEVTSPEATCWVPAPSHWMPLPAAPASCDRNPKGEDRHGLRAEHESAVPEGQTP